MGDLSREYIFEFLGFRDICTLTINYFPDVNPVNFIGLFKKKHPIGLFTSPTITAQYILLDI